jgi:hypothetical protein
MLGLFFSLCNDAFGGFGVASLVLLIVAVVLRVFVPRNLDITW